MRLLRALWHPLTPVVLLGVALPLATLLVPADWRGWTVVAAVIGGPLGAIASVVALRATLARIPVPADAPATSAQERTLLRSLRWLLALVTILSPPVMVMAVIGALAQRNDPGSRPAMFLLLVPLFFTLLGWRLWQDLASARRRRAQGLEPLALERRTWTGDARLDELVGRKPKMTGWVALIIAFGSALAFLSLRHSILVQLAKVDALIVQGQYWRFLTASFVHEDLTALAVSVLALFVVGPLVEMFLGPRWLLAILVGGGIASTAASFAFVAEDYAGTTGAVAALVGTLVSFAVRQRGRLPPATARRIAAHGLTAVAILVFAGVLLPNADSAAHLGGFAFGLVAGVLVDPSPAVRAALEKARQEALAEA